MSRQKIKKTLAGKIVSYATQGYLYAEIIIVTNLQVAIVVWSEDEYDDKFIRYAAKNCKCVNFKVETLLSNSIDTGFFAY